MWSAVIYCNKKVLMSPSIFLTISQTSNVCQKNAGSVWPSVQLTVEVKLAAGARELEGVGKLHRLHRGTGGRRV